MGVGAKPCVNRRRGFDTVSPSNTHKFTGTIGGYYDNPEKYQYEESEIATVNGFNIADLVELTKSEVNEIKKQVLKLIRELNITEYADLVDILVDNELMSEYDVVINNTFFFNTYIASRRNSNSFTKITDTIKSKRALL